MNDQQQEYPYWIAFSQIQGMKNAKKNELISSWNEKQMSIIDFFRLDAPQLQNNFMLSNWEISKIDDTKKDLPNYSFLVEDLMEQGYDIIPIISPDYSQTLKDNLGPTYAPPLIYTKGNKQIMHEKSVAIVGSRNAKEVSLEFTDAVAKKASNEYKVVVSGFAKGVDKQALDSAIKYTGQSIIVLPQGITTFKSGFKKYYKQIIDGDVLVLSAFFPKAPWSVQLAMARNPIIYGLTNEIFVAESGSSGGTWAGVIDGLRKGRSIYVRVPGDNEKNANLKLIEKGAIPVDEKGEKISKEVTGQIQMSFVEGPGQVYDSIDARIEELLSSGDYSSSEIISRLKLNWSPGKMTQYLKKNNSIKVVSNKSPIKFTIKNRVVRQQTLF